MTQINHMFGRTLEFSCTTEDGHIQSQELVHSGNDALITFRLDRGSFLTPENLRIIADQIEGKGVGRITLTTPEEHDGYIAKAKKYMIQFMPTFAQNPAAIYATAEYMAQQDGKTLYASHGECVSFAEDDDEEEWDEYGYDFSR